MTGQEKSTISPKFKFWHYFPMVIILGLAGYFLYPQIALLVRSWYVVKTMTLWAVIAAVIMETISWLGNGLIFHYIFKANGHKLSIGRGALIAIGTLAISLVAGVGVGLAVSYGWLYRESKDGNSAFLAGTLPAFFNTGAIIFASIIGTIHLFVFHDLNRAQLVEFALALLFLSGIAALAIAALRAENTVKRVGVWAMGHFARLRQQEYSPEKTIDSIDRFFETSKSMAHGKWLWALLGAFINVGFDMVAMFFLFIAAGNEVSLGMLFAGYGLPLMLGKLAFMFPAGIGVIESSMVVLFNSLGVPNDISVVVMMGYRLLSLWLPTILGFGAAAYLSGKFFHPKNDLNK